MPTFSVENQRFLDHLTTIVESNLENEHFGVNDLAVEVGKSRSYIHRRLKKLTNESISKFICRIRLEKALELLDKSELNVSEVAFKVGFGSPSYFIKCFHEKFGYSPGEYQSNIDKYVESKELTNSRIESVSKKKFYQKRRWLIWGIVILLVPLFFLVNNYVLNNSWKTDPGKSIAVLPFKNLSVDEENKHFAEGITDDIINHLSKINDFTVKSGTSTEKYRNIVKSSSKIAKELGVSYIIGGSAQKYKERVKIIIQLNDCNGDQIWADSYDREFEDIFNLQNEIAQQIATELETILSPNEIEKINKQYTKNVEAYNYYLRGKFYHRLIKEDSFEKSLEYYHKALELDSNYCLAFAGLADVYLNSTPYGIFTKEEGISKSRAYALKALSIDKNLAEAHIVLGKIAYQYDFDWDTAENELKLAMKLAPNYFGAYSSYAGYLRSIGKMEEALKYSKKALELNPNDWLTLLGSCLLYSRIGNYNKALELADNLVFSGHFKGPYRWHFEIFLAQDSILKAIEEYKKIVEYKFPERKPEMLDTIYTKEGKNGLIRFLIEVEPELVSPGRIAVYYAMLNEKDSALTYLELGYKTNPAWTLRHINETEFEKYHSDPRFIALLEKMNLPYK